MIRKCISIALAWLLSGAGALARAEETPPTQVNLQTQFAPGQYTGVASNPLQQRMQAIQFQIQQCAGQEQQIAEQEKFLESSLYEKAKKNGVIRGDVLSKKKTGGGSEDSVDLAIETLTETTKTGVSALTGQTTNPASQYDLAALCQDPSLDPKSLSCEKFKVSGRFDSNAVKNLKEALDVQGEACQLRQTKLDRLRKKLECFSVQAGALTEAMSLSSQEFTANIQNAQKEVSEIQAAEMDRAGQLAEVNDRLGASGNAMDQQSSVRSRSEKGLIELMQASREALDKLPETISSVESDNAALVNEKKVIENLVESRKASFMGECFKTETRSSYRCDAKGKSVSAKEYLLCRYEQNQYLGKGGKLETDDRKKELAAGKRAALESALDAILADIPSSAAPTPGKQQETVFATGGKVKTPEDVMKKYGAQLRSLAAGGINVYSFVTQAMKSCYSKADRAVDEERQLPNSEIGMRQTNLQNNERKVRAETEKAIEKYARNLSDIVESLTGVPTPFNTDGCKSVKPSDKVACLKDLQRNLTVMVKGTGPQSRIRMNIAAKQDVTGGRNITFDCFGLQGCVRTLQNVSKNLSTEIGRIQKYRSDRVMAINNTVQSQVQSYQQGFQPVVLQLQQSLQSMNLELAKLGGEKGIEVKPLECKPLEPNEQLGGLFNPPTDIVALIGGCSNPPMPNVSSNDFSEAVGGLSDAGKQIQEASTKVRELAGVVEGKFASCRSQDLAEQKKSIKEDLNEFQNQNCGYVKEYCDKKQPLESFEEVLGSLETEYGVDAPEFTAFKQLESGVKRLCDPYARDIASEEKKPDKTILDEGKANIEKCVDELKSPSDNCKFEAQPQAESKPDDVDRFLRACCTGKEGLGSGFTLASISIYIDHLKREAAAKDLKKKGSDAKNSCDSINTSISEKFENFGKSKESGEKSEAN